MGTGFRGTFVISWSQTILDGRHGAPLTDLRIGAEWSWSGESMRVDGPTSVLPLPDATGLTGIRSRARLAAQRLLRSVGVDSGDRMPLTQTAVEVAAAAGFTVTDGRASWDLEMLDGLADRSPLLSCAGTMPPRGVALWIVSLRLPEHRVARNSAPGGVICFTPGTMIRTPAGARPVEALSEGDLVQTKDNGPQPILWKGQRRISGARLYTMPHLRPVRIRAGVLGHDVPDAELLVSPDHRIILRGTRSHALFNTQEVLVAARDLVDDHGVTVDHLAREVSYFHLLLPTHQVVFANGVETESFHPALAELGTMEDAQLAAMLQRLPDFAGDPASYGLCARRVLSAPEAAILRYDAGLARLGKISCGI